MKVLISTILFIGIFALMFFGCDSTNDITGPQTQIEKKPYFGYKGDLVAGQTTKIGEFTVTSDGNNITVTYTITDSKWYLTTTHLYVGLSKPSTSAPGQFPYKHENIGYVQSDEYTISYADIGANTGDDIWIAAHADAEMPGGLGGIEIVLPETATMKVKYPYAGGPSYFETTIAGGTILDGLYLGWCIDVDHTIGQNTWYQVMVYSSYEALPGGIVVYPENLDKVNWIINQRFVGKVSTCGGNYTYGDVQRAIWALIEDHQSTSGLGSWSQCRVDEILAAANAYGEGFEPDCGDVVAIILRPINGQQTTIIQTTFAAIQILCNSLDETAWAYGFVGQQTEISQFRQGWGWYFKYTLQ